MENVISNIQIEKSSFKIWKDWKIKRGMDPDDSDFNHPNKFMRVIYYVLWGKKIDVGKMLENEKGEQVHIYENGWGRFSTSYVYNVDDKKYLWGGETINTIASYIEDAEKKIEDVEKKDEELEKLFNSLCERSHQVGNFELVPAYFNKS